MSYDCNKRMFLTECELPLYHCKGGLAHMYSITWCLFQNKMSINWIVSFKQLTYPGPTTVSLFRNALYIITMVTLCNFLIGRAVFWKYHRFLSFAHKHTIATALPHARYRCCRCHGNQCFFIKKEEKHKISRVLQKFDAFWEIFIGVFVSDLKDKIAWWSAGKPHEILW